MTLFKIYLIVAFILAVGSAMVAVWFDEDNTFTVNHSLVAGICWPFCVPVFLTMALREWVRKPKW